MARVKITCRGYTGDDKERRIIINADMPADKWTLIAHVIMRFFVSKASPLVDLDFDMLECDAWCAGKKCSNRKDWVKQARNAEKIIKNKPTW